MYFTVAKTSKGNLANKESARMSSAAGCSALIAAAL
jgi:hypothetical protein